MHRCNRCARLFRNRKSQLIEFIIRKNEYTVPQLDRAGCERAMIADKEEFPQEMPCCVCGFRWMQHKGRLCPSRPGYFDPVSGQPVAPVFGNTEFIPDVNFYKEPDFDAV
jgi:hypothetical protein